MENTNINNENQGGPELPAGSVTVSEPPGPGVFRVTTSGTGVIKSPMIIRNQRTCRVGHSKEKWSHDENRFLWECYVTSCHPIRRGYMKRKYILWTNGGMRDISAQRLATQVQNIKKKQMLSEIEMRQIHFNVIGDQAAMPDTTENSSLNELSENDLNTNDSSVIIEGDVIVDVNEHGDVNERTDFRDISEDTNVHHVEEVNEVVEGEIDVMEQNVIIDRLREVIDECKLGDVHVPSIKHVKWTETKNR